MMARDCYKCISKVWGSQCGYNGSGIGDGEQASSCVDYSRTRVVRWYKDWRSGHHSINRTRWYE